MADNDFHVVTGAFGFSGSYMAQRLLDAGCRVRTLTNSPNRRNPFGGRIEAHPYNFDNPDALAESLRGARVLYNTYWVRFSPKGSAYIEAIENTRILFDAAKKAGVGRIVHVSIVNAFEGSKLTYFRAKALVEHDLKQLGIPYAILRPAVLFGREGILINNIAWMLRKFPVFALFGDGKCKLQPTYVGDLAKLAVEQGDNPESHVVDATGPETYTYRGLIEMIGAAIGKRRLLVPISPSVGYLAGKVMGKIMGDIVMTRDEINGLMHNYLFTHSSPAGKTRLSDWVEKHKQNLGIRYMGELVRRTDRERAYSEL